jgi:hypothetical protein
MRPIAIKKVFVFVNPFCMFVWVVFFARDNPVLPAVLYNIKYKLYMM